MSKENLFEKFTLEETKSVLQEISEYMDQVINNARFRNHRYSLYEHR